MARIRIQNNRFDDDDDDDDDDEDFCLLSLSLSLSWSAIVLHTVSCFIVMTIMVFYFKKNKNDTSGASKHSSQTQRGALTVYSGQVLMGIGQCSVCLKSCTCVNVSLTCLEMHA